MSLLDDFEAALERARQAQEELLSRHGGNPPELAEHFQTMQDKTAGSMSWLRQLSERMEQSKAKVKAQLEAESRADRPTEEGLDFETYAWQFKDEHALPPDKRRQLLTDLGVPLETPPQEPAPVPQTPPAKLPPPPAPEPPPVPLVRKPKPRDDYHLPEQDGDTLDVRDFDG
jgi:hypothetical protein